MLVWGSNTTRACMYVCMYVCMFVCMCMCVYVHLTCNVIKEHSVTPFLRHKVQECGNASSQCTGSWLNRLWCSRFIPNFALSRSFGRAFHLTHASRHQRGASWDTHTHTHTHTHTQAAWHNFMEAGLCLHCTKVRVSRQCLAVLGSSELRSSELSSADRLLVGVRASRRCTLAA